MVKYRIIELLERAAQEAQSKGLLPPESLPEVTVEHPQNPEHGDYASSLPLKLGRAARKNPLEVAQTLVGHLPPAEEVARAWAAPPGFVNIVLSDRWLAGQVEAILEAGSSYGNTDLGRGSRVQIEFVSVNPTGPLHVGHGRGAILGSTLANVLQAAGYRVEREYYVNDAGAQMDAFYRSLYARYCQALGKDIPMPPNGYVGDYLVDMARELVAEAGDSPLTLPPEEGIRQIGKRGLEKIMASIRETLELLRVHFDVWFNEQSLYQKGQYERAMSLLRQGGYTAEKEGAMWFVSTALGEDKDNVLVRSSGAPTYFASDVAYHYNKFLERQFDTVINIWGADHQGHVSRMKAVVAALGIAPGRLKVIITQMVTLRRAEEVLRLSKRKGEVITLRELVEEVGPDVCRFFFLARSADSQMDFDLALAKEQSADNPVYYVQYAHARIASILRLAQSKSIDYSDGDVSLLRAAPELALIRKMLTLPELVELIAQSLEPHHLPYYAQELATLFHAFYRDCRVVSSDEALTKARLKLVAATKAVLARTLGLMGMTAPEQM